MDLSNLNNLLKPYLSAQPGRTLPGAEDHFEQVAHGARDEDLSDGVTEALRSEHTPPFGQLVAQAFGRGNPMQRARILNQLIRSAGPVLMNSLAGGALANIFRQRAQQGAAPMEISPDEAAKVDPREVEHVAREAESREPSVVSSMGGVLAKHPDLVKGLGGAVLTLALARIAQRMQH